MNTATMTFAEDDLLPLSALQHLMFCERQCALIHLEQVWADNRLTVEGSHLHRKVDEAPGETRGDVRIARGVPLRSLRLGLIGKADVVELHRIRRVADGEDRRADDAGGAVPGWFRDRRGRWRPMPVEYKRGRPKRHRADEVQLCAQALCLEEMLELEIPAGALFYGQTRHRSEVPFDSVLREETERAAARLHELIRAGITPKARREPKCDSCSLLHHCLPQAMSAGRSAARYLDRSLEEQEPLAGGPSAASQPTDLP